MVQTRMILIRETNGDLRTAAPEERDAVNFKYFPKTGKLSQPIVAFEDNYLKVDSSFARWHRHNCADDPE